VSLRDFERLASGAMTRAAWEFISSGAGDELTVRWNEEAFARLRLRQRALVDVARLDTRLRLLGREWPHPIFLAPTSNHTLAHPEGEVATARGAGSAGATLVVSTFADKPLEEIAKAATQPWWHATYVMKDRGRTRDLLGRAEAARCEAICIPIDSPVVGARDREHRTYRFPHDPISFLDYPADYWRYPTTWKDIDWVRAQTKLPMVLKGVLDPEDADRAIRAGAAAIYVSNHGGRNLDTLPATLDVLPEVAERVAGRVPILVDGGVRRGTDVLKALALGAAAVAIGRPYLYGLAIAGADGIRGVVNVLRNELEMAMALTGRPSIASLDRSLILPAAGSPKG
jgi:4-hydroxymandelate oxidase